MAAVSDVVWSRAATEDLFVKVSPEVAEELVEVAREILDEPPSKDGGPIIGGWWRRGISRRRRMEIDAAERAGAELDTPGDHAWNYILVYDRLNGPRRRFRVLAVFSAGELGAGINDIPNLDTVPSFD
ncbi:hypothetical protein SUDANB95_06878 [Actinosynnema sp. ALI-1.44]